MKFEGRENGRVQVVEKLMMMIALTRDSECFIKALRMAYIGSRLVRYA